MTLKGFLKQDQSSLEQLDDFKVIRDANTSLSGNPAHDVIYTFTANDQQNHKSERISSIINNKSYIILLDSTVEKFDSYVPFLRQILSSFEIPDPIESQYYQSLLNSTLINRPSEGKNSSINLARVLR